MGRNPAGGHRAGVWFVVLNEMMDGVIPSQVVIPARVLSSLGPDVEVGILFLEPVRVALSPAARKRMQQLRMLWPGGQMSLVPFVGRLGKHSPARSLRIAIRWKSGLGRRLILHCRGPRSTLQAAKAMERTGARIIFDSRGASDAEARLRLGSRGVTDGDLRFTRAVAEGRDVDRRAFLEADSVLAVSRSLAGRFVDAGLPAGKIAGVVPCCVEGSRFSSSGRRAVRAALGLGEREVLGVHTSTSVQWEDFGLVERLFRGLRSRFRCRLLFLTTIPPREIMARLDPDAPRDYIEIRSAAPAEVADHLSAADLGFLLRTPHETHRVASPIKFPEYLSAGLPVAISEGIGEFAEVVREAGIGVVVPPGPSTGDLLDATERLTHLLGGDREYTRAKAMEACVDLFTWEHHLPTILRAYGIEP